MKQKAIFLYPPCRIIMVAKWLYPDQTAPLSQGIHAQPGICSNSPSEKFDGFAKVMADVLDEATSLNSPVKTYRYLNKFTKQNDEELTKLLTDLEPWQSKMNLEGKANFAKMRLPSLMDGNWVRLVPKVTKMMANGDYKLGKLEQALLLFKLKRVLK